MESNIDSFLFNEFDKDYDLKDKFEEMKINIMLPDANVTGKGTDMDMETLSDIAEKLEICGVNSEYALSTASVMKKKGVRYGLKWGYSHGYFDAFKIEEKTEESIDGEYYVNNYVFAKYSVDI